MEQKELKKVLFTHDDLDGAGCTVLFELACRLANRDFAIINCHNQSVDKDVQNYISENHESAEFYFADICCSEELLKSIAADMCTDDELVHVFDHHITNKFAYNVPGVDARILSGDDTVKMQCGASILEKDIVCEPIWFDKNVQRFVNTVRAWDTFDWQNYPENSLIRIEAPLLNSLFHTLGMKLFCDTYVDEFLSRESDEYWESVIPNKYLLELAKYQVELEEKAIESFASALAPKFNFKVEENGHLRTLKGAYFVCPGSLNISTAMTEWLKRNPDVDIAIMYMPQYGTLSLRTIREDVSVAEICKACGGGGHPKAAGCPAPKELSQVSGIIKKYIEAAYTIF